LPYKGGLEEQKKTNLGENSGKKKRIGGEGGDGKDQKE